MRERSPLQKWRGAGGEAARGLAELFITKMS